jgi:NAD(P)-dependent dehydrogenase (short-subunit alcohol dehydrogenase family)
MNSEMQNRILEGRAAIITGAGRGVAKGVATAFVKAGAKLLIIDRDPETGMQTEAELRALGGDVLFKQVDLADRSALPGIVTIAVETFGKLDVLVNAAQASQQLLLKDTSVEAMNLAFDTGFWPTFLLMQAAYPHLVASKGSVINFASGAGLNGQPTQASYGAAKEAIRAISKVAANEWGRDGIRVNIVCPFANSPGVETWKEHFPAEYQQTIDQVPLRRIGDCETDIGEAVVFLASGAARYITGQTLMVDGGQTKIC